jgi:hypothetical protein
MNLPQTAVDGTDEKKPFFLSRSALRGILEKGEEKYGLLTRSRKVSMDVHCFSRDPRKQEKKGATSGLITSRRKVSMDIRRLVSPV